MKPQASVRKLPVMRGLPAAREMAISEPGLTEVPQTPGLSASARTVETALASTVRGAFELSLGIHRMLRRAKSTGKRPLSQPFRAARGTLFQRSQMGLKAGSDLRAFSGVQLSAYVPPQLAS